MHNLYFGKKVAPKLGAISVIFKNLPKVNTCPLGENLPNLVTLISRISQILKQNCSAWPVLQGCQICHGITHQSGGKSYQTTAKCN
jgi:hypothetical protein